MNKTSNMVTTDSVTNLSASVLRHDNAISTTDVMTYYNNGSTDFHDNTTMLMPMTSFLEKPDDRSIDFVIVAVLTCTNLYMSVASVCYYVRFSQNNLKWTDRICCVSAFALLFESCWFQSELNLTQVSSQFCNIYTVINLFVSTSNKTLIYVVFWIRQRSFYKTFSFLKVSQAKFSCLSNSLLAGIIAFAIVQVSTLTCLPLFASPRGCEYGKPDPFLEVFTPIIFFIIAMFQVFLLAPVLYPIVRHIRAARKGVTDQKLEVVVIRLSVCASVCLISDIIFIVVSVREPAPNESFSFIPILYSINMTINVMGMLTSFADYKLRLLPFLTRQKKVHSKVEAGCVNTGTQFVVTAV